jgi:hypothetical protein
MNLPRGGSELGNFQTVIYTEGRGRKLGSSWQISTSEIYGRGPTVGLYEDAALEIKSMKNLVTPSAYCWRGGASYLMCHFFVIFLLFFNFISLNTLFLGQNYFYHTTFPILSVFKGNVSRLNIVSTTVGGLGNTYTLTSGVDWVQLKNKIFLQLVSVCWFKCYSAGDAYRYFIRTTQYWGAFRNHCYRRKVISITYYECVSSISHTTCKAHAPYYIVICGLNGCTIFFRII